MQSSLPAGWLAFTGRELNPLDRYERFQITFSFPFPEFFLAQRTAGFPQYGWKAGVSDETFPAPFVHLVVTPVIPHCVGPWTR
jgi:hypothetical protein